MSQLPSQTAKIFLSLFDVHLCSPHFEKGSSTTDTVKKCNAKEKTSNSVWLLQLTKILVKLDMWVTSFATPQYKLTS